MDKKMEITLLCEGREGRPHKFVSISTVVSIEVFALKFTP